MELGRASAALSSPYSSLHINILCYISYDFHEVLLIKLAIVEYNCAYCKNIADFISYYLV